MKRIYGRFEISIPLIESDTEKLSKVFEGLIVTRAESMYPNKTIEYVAWSPHFRELEEGMRVPEYVAEFTRDKEGGITIKWVEQK